MINRTELSTGFSHKINDHQLGAVNLLSTSICTVTWLLLLPAAFTPALFINSLIQCTVISWFFAMDYDVISFPSVQLTWQGEGGLPASFTGFAPVNHHFAFSIFLFKFNSYGTSYFELSNCSLRFSSNSSLANSVAHVQGQPDHVHWQQCPLYDDTQLYNVLLP